MNRKKGKVYKTFSELKKTSVQHYGDTPLSVPKFIYYSFFKINTFIVFVMDLTRELPPHELDSDFTVVKPTIEELRAYREGLDHLPREFYYDELHGIKNVYLVLCNNEIAYIHWVYVKGDPNRFLRLSDGVAELNYNTTLPKFRGRGLMKKMMRYIHLDLKKQGFTKACGLANADNIPAVKSALRAGFQVHSRVKAIGPLNRKIDI